MTRPTPTLSEPVVAEWWKNHRGESIRVTLSTYAERNLVDVRTWITDPAEGRLKPTTKGLAVEVRHLAQLKAASPKLDPKRASCTLSRSTTGGDQ